MKSILLIEDDPFLTDLYVTKLSRANFSVKVAKNGEQALKKIKEQIFDLVVLDIVLPLLDGWQVLEELKKDLRTKKIPVIILSNLSQSNEIKKGLELGAVKYLVKAYYSPTEILEEIKKVLE